MKLSIVLLNEQTEEAFNSRRNSERDLFRIRTPRLHQADNPRYFSGSSLPRYRDLREQIYPWPAADLCSSSLASKAEGGRREKEKKWKGEKKEKMGSRMKLEGKARRLCRPAWARASRSIFLPLILSHVRIFPALLFVHRRTRLDHVAYYFHYDG